MAWVSRACRGNSYLLCARFFLVTMWTDPNPIDNNGDILLYVMKNVTTGGNRVHLARCRRYIGECHGLNLPLSGWFVFSRALGQPLSSPLPHLPVFSSSFSSSLLLLSLLMFLSSFFSSLDHHSEEKINCHPVILIC